MEIWKDIELNNLYQISNLGMVKSKSRRVNGGYGARNTREVILKPCVNEDGYLYVSIRNAQYKSKHLSIHRLVALAFIPNPENKPCINHKDLDKKNNSIENLEWCTIGENVRHAVSNGITRWTYRTDK